MFVKPSTYEVVGFQSITFLIFPFIVSFGDNSSAPELSWVRGVFKQPFFLYSYFKKILGHVRISAFNLKGTKSFSSTVRTPLSLSQGHILAPNLELSSPSHMIRRVYLSQGVLLGCARACMHDGGVQGMRSTSFLTDTTMPKFMSLTF